MLQPRRGPIERPPSKIAGAVYVVIGFLALCVSAFVLFYEGTFIGPVTNFRTGFGIVIAVYGAFRIFTGFSMLRKAAKMQNSLSIPRETNSPSSKPPIE